MGGSVTGHMMWERKGSTDSRRRTCVAPESWAHWNVGRWPSQGGWGRHRGYVRGELGGARLHKLARASMVTSMTRWPPVGGHPTMEVTIEVELGRARETRAGEVGFRGAHLLFWLVLSFLALLFALLSRAFLL
jgi:hypothetical protein